MQHEQEERDQTYALAADATDKAGAETRNAVQKNRNSNVVEHEAARKTECARRYARKSYGQASVRLATIRGGPHGPTFTRLARQRIEAYLKGAQFLNRKRAQLIKITPDTYQAI